MPPLATAELVGARLYTGPMFVKYNGVLVLARTARGSVRRQPARPTHRSLAGQRGLRSDSPFLKNSMVTLCCPRAVGEAYMGETPWNQLFLPAKGSLSLAEALRSVNKYPTTLHGINSAIIKVRRERCRVCAPLTRAPSCRRQIGKLTMATKVYRGIAGMALPEAFWKANQFGVKGESTPTRPLPSPRARTPAQCHFAGPCRWR